MARAISGSLPALRVAGTAPESLVDGPGLRYCLFVQGCPHGCPGCHNPQTHDFAGGTMAEGAAVLAHIRANPLTRGVTFSGGEPFCQAEALTPLAQELRKAGYHLMAYSGYTWEALLSSTAHKTLLHCLDLLVDGPFIQERRTLLCPFRGSDNQRILDVPASLLAQSPMLWTQCPPF